MGLGDPHGGMRPLGNTWGHGAGTWGGFRGQAGTRDGAGTWGGFRGQVGTWGWDMGVGLEDQHRGMRPLG